MSPIPSMPSADRPASAVVVRLRAFRYSLALATVLLTMPWLFPLATGPLPSAVPWLFSLLCAGIAALLFVARNHATLGALWVDLAKVLAWSVFVAAVVSVGLALVQYFGLEKPFVPWIASSFKGESFANLRQRNQFASLVVMGLFAASYLASSRGAMQRKWVLGLMLLASTWLGLGNAMSASRTGLAELLLAGCAIALWAWRSGVAGRLWALLAANVLGFMFGNLVLPMFKTGAERLADRAAMGAEGCHSRLILWHNVWQLALEKPLTGWGWGSLKEAHYQGVFAANNRFCEILDNAHNLPLHLAVELGLVVAGIWVLATLWLLWRTWPTTLAKDHGFAASHMACGMLGVVLLHSMLEYPLWYGPFQITAGLSVLLLWTYRVGQAPQTAAKKPFFMGFGLPVSVFITLFATLSIAYALFAMWDYRRVSQIFIEPEQRAAAYRENTFDKIRDSRLFAEQVDFADLAINPVTVENATERMPLALRMLKISPEPRVIENVLLGAHATGRAELLQFHLPRYKAAFPIEYAAWAATPVGSAILSR